MAFTPPPVDPDTGQALFDQEISQEGVYADAVQEEAMAKADALHAERNKEGETSELSGVEAATEVAPEAPEAVPDAPDSPAAAE
jgi:hypothetical protein